MRVLQNSARLASALLIIAAGSPAAALDDVDADVTDVIDLNAPDTFLTSAEATLS